MASNFYLFRFIFKLAYSKTKNFKNKNIYLFGCVRPPLRRTGFLFRLLWWCVDSLAAAVRA